MNITSLHCFAPRPAHADLPPIAAACWRVIDDARGIFKRHGYLTGYIHARVLADSDLPKAPTREQIERALRELERRGLVTCVADRWAKVN